MFHLPGFQKGQQPLREIRTGEEDAAGIRRQGAQQGQYGGHPILVVVYPMEIVQHDETCRILSGPF